MIFAVTDARPIVVTGSQRAPEEPGTDAYVNIRHAIYTACEINLRQAGTVVVFNERIFAARYVKVHASNIQGFSAFGFGYLGIIDNDQVFCIKNHWSMSVLIFALIYQKWL